MLSKDRIEEIAAAHYGTMATNQELEFARAVAEAAVKDEREAIDALVDEECAKLQTDDKSLDYWHGVGAAVTAMENAIRARGEKPI